MPPPLWDYFDEELRNFSRDSRRNDTKNSSVPTKIMVLDVAISTCIIVQLSGLVMIDSISLKSRFGEKLWFNGACMALQLHAQVRSFFCVLPVYFNWANAILAVKLHCPNICWNIYFGEWTCLDCFARQLQFTVAWYIQYLLQKRLYIVYILYVSCSHENSLKETSDYYQHHSVRLA